MDIDERKRTRDRSFTADEIVQQFKDFLGEELYREFQENLASDIRRNILNKEK
jgi:hypothetical protein